MGKAECEGEDMGRAVGKIRYRGLARFRFCRFLSFALEMWVSAWWCVSGAWLGGLLWICHGGGCRWAIFEVFCGHC